MDEVCFCNVCGASSKDMIDDKVLVRYTDKLYLCFACLSTGMQAAIKCLREHEKVVKVGKAS